MSENKTTASEAPAAPENVSKAGAPLALDTSARDAKDGGPTVEELAEEASALEEAVRAEAKRNEWKSCCHVFGEPFRFQGLTFERLDFDWARLTGRDSLAIEEEILIRKRKTVVDAKFSTDYLCGMAVRACTSQSAEGKAFSVFAMEALPLGVFQKICGSARNFLIIAESWQETAAPGSGSSASS